MSNIIEIIIPNYLPKTKARPRVFKGRVWTPSHSAEKNLAHLIAIKNGNKIQIDKDIGVEIEIKSKKKMRGDIDNYQKFIYDAMQKSGIIVNDKQIKRSNAEMVPSTINQLMIKIYSLE